MCCRFGKRFQCRSYSRSSWYGNGRPDIHAPVPVKTQGSQSWSAFVIVCYFNLVAATLICADF